jgi:hypothetical protein
MTKVARWQILMLALLLSALFGEGARATTYTAASCSTSDVQAAINKASSGDTVVTPTATATWSSGVIAPVAITLQFNCTITDADTSTSDALITMTLDSSHHAILAGTGPVQGTGFLPGSGTNNYVLLSGAGLIPVVHDLAFQIPNFQIQHAIEWGVTGGLAYNDIWYSLDSSNPGSDSGCMVFKPGINWDAPSTLGMLDTGGVSNVYIENSIFSNVGQCPDIDDDGRVVIRYSQIINSSGLTHGITSTYGGRQYEFYANSFQYVEFPNGSSNARNLNRYFWSRAATGLFADNVIQQINSGSWYGIQNSFQFIVEGAQRSSSHGCVTQYMGYHQSGSGSSPAAQNPVWTSSNQTPPDQFQIPDPVYIWNNSGTGTGLGNMGIADGGPLGCPGTNPATGLQYTSSDFFVLNRDWVVDNGAKPGWVPYTYPHPLNTSGKQLVAPPAFSLLPNSTFSNSQTVTLTSLLTPGATICYTTDGSTPTESGNACSGGTTQTYSSPITISSSKTISAIGTKSGFADSFVAIATYTITGLPQVATPTFTPSAGSYSNSQSVTINCPSGATCFYTTSGQAPQSANTPGTVYSGPIAINQTTNINVIAVKSGSTNSALGSALYFITNSGTKPAPASNLAGVAH